MVISRSARILAIAALAVSSVIANVGPVAAETVTSPCSDSCGGYFAYDDQLANQGATCTYKTVASSFGDHVINKIIVRPPEMDGRYSAMTPVSWRFKIQRRQSEGVEGPVHTTIIHTSTWQTAQASLTRYAYLGFGFTNRTWTVNADPSSAIFGSYRVIINMRWSNHGVVEGRETFRYDWYREQMGSDYVINGPWCYGVYPDA